MTLPSPNLDTAALRLAARGWPVFPLRPGSKLPAIRDWEHRATTDPERIAAWWSRAPYNIGIACGPAGLVVLDLDAAHGHQPPRGWSGEVRHGRDVLRLLAREAGEPDPVDTYTVTTPSGGEHRYFLTPPGQPELRNTTGDTGRGLGWHIDTRAAGGSITAAGSIRFIGRELRRYRAVRGRPPAPLPGWLYDALSGRSPGLTGPTGTTRPAGVSDAAASAEDGTAGGGAAGGGARRTSRPLPPAGPRLDAYVQAALDDEADAVRKAEPGIRATTLFRAAAHLGEIVGSGALDPATVMSVLRHAASYHLGVDGWTDQESRHHIANGMAAGLRHPRAG
jgi:hypothetical protein